LSLPSLKTKGFPMERKSLSDILHAGERDSLSQSWNSTKAAGESTPLPTGRYDCHASGELFTSRNGTPGYKLTFKLLDGEYAGRHVWHDRWLTPAAMPMTKRDLAKLGITSLEQLDRPLQQGIRCRMQIVQREADDGVKYNQVRSFEFMGIDTPVADPFAPAPATASTGQTSTGTPRAVAATPAVEPGDAKEPEGEVDVSFDPDSFSESEPK
jgi:hypothetical protein